MPRRHRQEIEVTVLPAPTALSNRQRSAVIADDPLDNREPQAAAAGAGARGRGRTARDVADLAGRNADRPIRHLNPDRAVSRVALIVSERMSFE